MILKGRQIFSHIENTESLPAKLYGLAVQHTILHKDQNKTCDVCEGLFKYLPPGFNKEEVFYERNGVIISTVKDSRERPIFDDALVERIIAQRSSKIKKADKKKSTVRSLPPRKLVFKAIRKNE